MAQEPQIKRKLIDREILDAPDGCSNEEIKHNLRDIAIMNRWFGGRYAVTNHLFRFIANHPANQVVRILDIATGSADIPVYITKWARKRNIHVKITALDINPLVIEIAKEAVKTYPEICIETQDILTLRYPASSFDYVICSQIIHHLETENVLSLIKSANTIASQGIVISDLLRSPSCIFLAKLLSPLITNMLSRHDLVASFENAFTPSEMKILAGMAGLPYYRVYIHRPCRMVLTVDKRNVISDKKVKITKRAASPV